MSVNVEGLSDSNVKNNCLLLSAKTIHASLVPWRNVYRNLVFL